MLPYPDDSAAMPSLYQGFKDGRSGYYPRLSRNFQPPLITPDAEAVYYKGWRTGYDRWKVRRAVGSGSFSWEDQDSATERAEPDLG